MAQAPWYMDTGRPSLKHQKAPDYNDSPDKLADRFIRGVQKVCYSIRAPEVKAAGGIERLWHQLTLKLFEFFSQDLSRSYRLDFFQNFVHDFESRINQLRLVELGVIVSKSIDSKPV